MSVPAVENMKQVQLWELRQMQGLPLEAKIEKSLKRINEWCDKWDGNVYVSFSGGKDSTVLLDLVKKVRSNVAIVFVDTGLEYPEIKQFVRSVPNVEILRPDMSFREVIQKYGYPMISKEQASFIQQYRVAKSEKTKNTRLNGNKYGRGKISKKWQYLIDAPFLISDQCCEVMKKKPFKQYEKETGLKPFIGKMASESDLRLQSYLQTGCNAFDNERPQSNPLSFWTDQDILQYLKQYQLPYSTIYGDITENKNGRFKTTKCERTGCMFCMFGVHLEKGLNRFQRMQITHPILWEYCINELDLKKTLDYIGVPYMRSNVNAEKYKIDTIKLSCRVDRNKLDILKRSYGNISNTELIDMLINEKVSDTYFQKT